MDFDHPAYTLQATPSTLQNVRGGLRKIFTSDPGLNLQLFLTLPILAGGIVLHLNVIQWVLILFVTFVFFMAGIFRRAALLQIKNKPVLTEFHESRIRTIGNALVMLTGAISLFTYMMVFVPRITEFL